MEFGEEVSPPHRERAWGGGYSMLSEFFFHFIIVHSGAFWCAKSKVIFAIKCRERYVIMVFLAIDSADTDVKTSSKLIPVQSVSSNLRRFHSYSRHVMSA